LDNLPVLKLYRIHPPPLKPHLFPPTHVLEGEVWAKNTPDLTFTTWILDVYVVGWEKVVVLVGVE
jgi:hypothetical protein